MCALCVPLHRTAKRIGWLTVLFLGQLQFSYSNTPPHLPHKSSGLDHSIFEPSNFKQTRAQTKTGKVYIIHYSCAYTEPHLDSFSHGVGNYCCSCSRRERERERESVFFARVQQHLGPLQASSFNCTEKETRTFLFGLYIYITHTHTRLGPRRLCSVALPVLLDMPRNVHLSLRLHVYTHTHTYTHMGKPFKWVSSRVQKAGGHRRYE